MVVGLVVGGGGGLELRLSPCATEELDAVDVVSFALSVVSLGSLGFEEPAFEFIPVATALGNGLIVDFTFRNFPRERGHMTCPEPIRCKHKQKNP